LMGSRSPFRNTCRPHVCFTGFLCSANRSLPMREYGCVQACHWSVPLKDTVQSSHAIQEHNKHTACVWRSGGTLTDLPSTPDRSYTRLRISATTSSSSSSMPAHRQWFAATAAMRQVHLSCQGSARSLLLVTNCPRMYAYAPQASLRFIDQATLHLCRTNTMWGRRDMQHIDRRARSG